MEEDSQQELMIKFRMFEQQIQLIQEQLQAVDYGILDLNELNTSVEELVGKAGSEILAHIGKGIYAKAKLISDELIVDVGGKNFVKKSVSETKKILKEQIIKLNEIKEELNNEMNKINEEVTKSFMENKDKIKD
jgi:prefoldin alpha subunit